MEAFREVGFSSIRRVQLSPSWSPSWPLLLLGGLLVTGCSLHPEVAPYSPCSTAVSSADFDWIGPTEPEDQERIARWCGVAGPPLANPEPDGAFDSPEAHDSLAVFSWNIDVGAGDLLTFLEQEVGLSCLGPNSTASPRFSHVVVLVQEAFHWAPDLPPLTDQSLAARKSRHVAHGRGDPDIAEVADQCGLSVVYVPSGRNGVDDPGERLHDKGNAILSTLPLSDFQAITLPFETERKVAVAATIPLGGGGSLRVVNAHLEVTTSFHRVLLTGNQTRLRQVEGLIEALNLGEGRGGDSLPMVLGGDFNTWSGRESALRMLWQEFPASPEWDGESTRGLFPTDHLFFRKALGGGPAERTPDGALGGAVLDPASYRLIEKKYSSDHHARFAWIRIGS